MRRPHPLSSLFLLSLLVFTSPLHAQTAADANEGLRLAAAPEGGVVQVLWWGRAGCLYFIEQSDDLSVWHALPAFEVGADAVASYGLLPPGPDQRLFVRVRRLSATLAQFQTQDTDQDGLLNAAEVAAGLNPFSRDTDEDGLPDGYELAFGLNPLLADALADKDGDGVPNQEDARPADATVGQLSVSIAAPISGSSL